MTLKFSKTEVAHKTKPRKTSRSREKLEKENEKRRRIFQFPHFPAMHFTDSSACHNQHLCDVTGLMARNEEKWDKSQTEIAGMNGN